MTAIADAVARIRARPAPVILLDTKGEPRGQELFLYEERFLTPPGAFPVQCSSPAPGWWSRTC
jgi:hypothetical protein